MLQLLILPGLDGTGARIAPFVRELEPSVQARIIGYPPDRPLGYAELEVLVRNALPIEGPYVLLAESFSGPIAIRLAAEPPPGLAASILCATFAKIPFHGCAPCAAGGAHYPSNRCRAGCARRSCGAPSTLGCAPAAAAARERGGGPAVIRRRLHEVLSADVAACLEAIPCPLDPRGDPRPHRAACRDARLVQRTRPGGAGGDRGAPSAAAVPPGRERRRHLAVFGALELNTPMLPMSEACERNKEPILCGAAHFLCRHSQCAGDRQRHRAARRLFCAPPDASDVASDRATELSCRSAARVQLEGGPNLRPPTVLDVRQSVWPVQSVDGVFTANTLHIMSWQEVVAMYRGIGEVLAPRGLLCVYGPFRYAGEYTSDSNRAFDRCCRSAIRAQDCGTCGRSRRSPPPMGSRCRRS